jgi:hypothetical protein
VPLTLQPDYSKLGSLGTIEDVAGTLIGRSGNLDAEMFSQKEKKVGARCIVASSQLCIRKIPAPLSIYPIYLCQYVRVRVYVYIYIYMSVPGVLLTRTVVRSAECPRTPSTTALGSAVSRPSLRSRL